MKPILLGYCLTYLSTPLRLYIYGSPRRVYVSSLASNNRSNYCNSI